jgi:hypothetical protein
VTRQQAKKGFSKSGKKSVNNPSKTNPASRGLFYLQLKTNKR